MGNTFSVADAYAFTVLSWKSRCSSTLQVAQRDGTWPVSARGPRCRRR